jgi:hypothetical protein
MFKYETDQELTLQIGGEPATPARVLERKREDIDGLYSVFYRVEAEGNDAHRTNGELWVQESELKERDLFERLDARRREGI